MNGPSLTDAHEPGDLSLARIAWQLELSNLIAVHGLLLDSDPRKAAVLAAIERKVGL